ncbi:MAG: hypothetical protein HW413_1664 [Thermoleophilia bacterium]|nr:hypothetical protein [Thermoleophilia bacterium]
MLQRSFGGFDQRFLGTWIEFGDRESFELFDACRLGAGPDSGPVRAARAAHPGLAETLLTTLDHERRHFHDYLIAPLGAATFRSHFVSLRLATELVVALREVGFLDHGCILPLPLPRWFRLSQAQQEDLVRRVNSFLGGGEVCRVASLDPGLAATLRDAVDAAAQPYDELWSMWETPETVRHLGVTPTHVWEASALLVQYATVTRYFGPEGLSALLEYVYAQPANRYVQSVRRLRAAFGRVEDDIDIELMSLIVTYALLGDRRDPIDLSSPAVRFLAVAAIVERDGVPDPRRPAAELFAAWDEALQCPGWEESLRVSLEVDDRYARELVADGDEEFAIYRATRRRAVESFLDDPDSYARAQRYVAASGDGLPRPPLLVKACGGWWDDAEHSGYTSYVQTVETTVASPLQAWHEDIDIRFAEDLLVRCTAASVLLDERHDRADPLDEAAVRRFASPGVVPIYVPSHVAARAGV